jgi:hypothetical protein
MKMGRIAAGLAMVGVLSTVFLFQNCGQAGFENMQTADEASTQSVDPKLATLPFPYQVSVNQIAHMACPIASSSLNTQSPYFSWKVGAYDNPSDQPTSLFNIGQAGLQINPQFQTAWSKLSTSFNVSIQKNKLKEALQTLPSVAGAKLQLSFRKTNTPRVDLMQMPGGGNSPTMNFLTDVSSDGIVQQFVDSPNGVFNMFPQVPDFYSRFLQGQLVIPSALGAPDAALRANYDSSFMSIGFVLPDTGALSAPSTTDDRFAYGKGFRVHYGVTNPHQGTTLYPSSDSLSTVEEYDLDTGNRTTDANWDCSYRFKIVRPADRYKTAYRANHFNLIGGACPTPAQTGDFCQSPVDPRFGIPPAAFGGQCPSTRTLVQNTTRCPEQYAAVCPHEPYTGNTADPIPSLRDDGIYHPNHPERPAILQALRRFLPADQWDVNVSRRCIVPKLDDDACYSQSSSSSAPVVYDETFFPDANANPNVGLYAGCGVNGQYQCAAYLTLCIRR